MRGKREHFLHQQPAPVQIRSPPPPTSSSSGPIPPPFGFCTPRPHKSRTKAGATRAAPQPWPSRCASFQRPASPAEGPAEGRRKLMRRGNQLVLPVSRAVLAPADCTSYARRVRISGARPERSWAARPPVISTAAPLQGGEGDRGEAPRCPTPTAAGLPDRWIGPSQ